MSSDERSEASRAGFLREANEDELLRVLIAAQDELTPDEARAVLLNPFTTAAVIEQLLAIRRLASNYRLQRDLARHRLVPLATALAIVPRLYWRDLAMLANDVQVRPQLRRSAEQRLIVRLPKLALGERIALARIASSALLVELRKDSNPRVFSSLLENPRLREGDLMPMLVGGAGTPAILELVARDRRWGQRYGVKRALVRNRNTPSGIAVGLVSSLNKQDQRALSVDPSVPEVVKQRCKLLLGDG